MAALYHTSRWLIYRQGTAFYCGRILFQRSGQSSIRSRTYATNRSAAGLSALLDMLFLHEHLGFGGFAGAVLILLSIFIPQLWERRLEKRLHIGWHKRPHKKEAGSHSRISAFPG